MRRDFCDGVGISCLLNATLVLPKFEVAAYWNESRLLESCLQSLHQKRVWLMTGYSIEGE
ncbi:hypothetical protein ACS0TY_001235 [Phlomoides rotata]